MSNNTPQTSPKEVNHVVSDNSEEYDDKQNRSEAPEKDIGNSVIKDIPPPYFEELQSERQRYLRDIGKEIGTSQVTRKQLEFAPSVFSEMDADVHNL